MIFGGGEGGESVVKVKIIKRSQTFKSFQMSRLSFIWFLCDANVDFLMSLIFVTIVAQCKWI